MDIARLITDRALKVDASGIRRVFDLGARLKDPINLSIGQPDFPVPDAIKRAGMDAIERDRNGYTVTQGIPELRERICRHLGDDLGWDTDPKPPNGPPHRPGLLVSPGTSASLVLAFMALVGPGDEAIIPDPYFVLYPHLATIVGGTAVRCDTYPDCQMTAERVERLITPRTKLVLLNSPGNPSGAVATQQQCAELLDLCRRRNILLISDEIYDEFTYAEARTERSHRGARPVCPSPARVPGSFEDMLIVRGLGKTYGVTGWRLGYAAGPARLIAEMTKLQQYTYVCAPAPLQWGGLAAFDADMSAHVAAYQKRRDLVAQRLGPVTEFARPGGAFYAFPRVPERLGLTATRFVDQAIERGLLIIPGSVFSDRDTHFRLSYATSEATLARGLDVLVDMMR
jgi:aspartate/methionine/tyrosine aminotransferase